MNGTLVVETWILVAFYGRTYLEGDIFARQQLLQDGSSYNDVDLKVS